MSDAETTQPPPSAPGPPEAPPIIRPGPYRDYIIAAYVLCIAAQVIFGLYAVVRYTLWLRTRRVAEQTAEEFITARGTQSGWRIAWSFFSSAVGAWCITAPPSFAVYAGIVGLVMYAIASGLPVLVIAIFGAYIQAKHPDVCTMPDFVGKRFGPVARTLMVCITLFNMAIALLAEYTTIGILFKLFVGSVDYPIVIVVGVITMMYTAYGGTYISIVTDQAQGILTSLFILVLFIYVAVTFRPESLPKPIPNDTTFTTGFPLGANKFGYSAIFSMPCSLMASTIFSEAMWQKVWASKDRRSVYFGGGIGFALITVAVFLFGFGGWLAAWAGYVTWNTDGNLYLFQVFATQRDDSINGASVYLNSWVGIITLVLAATMNESAIDSIQNGMSAVLATHFFKGQNSVFARVVLLIINIPLIVIALQGYQVLALFLMANTLTVCAFLMLSLGLVDRLQPYFSETAVIVGFSVAMLTVTAFGIGKHWNPDDHAWSIRYGAWYTWYGNTTYWWEYFAVAAGFSVIGAAMWAIPANLLRIFAGIHGPGISGLLKPLPGFNFITGSGFGFDLLSTKAMRPVAKALGHVPETLEGSSETSEDHPVAKDAKGFGDSPHAFKSEEAMAAAKLGDSALGGYSALTGTTSAMLTPATTVQYPPASEDPEAARAAPQ
ncbi:hypothetical protein HYH03_004490 [Edaphochlamys debaryana]|uniref:Uncharacterized protein n=1 Tax=Edaphochlamys debaryana TaxID=47281 RepID=A0A835Y775_9CHLO|nr:hypothetical protein HYH03_004490 [Edaphochlamys debaryana]|eukprot:KAG2497326.1 hypothetical protein HYH03_004490 [Edaphochlamys debaryana]